MEPPPPPPPPRTTTAAPAAAPPPVRSLETTAGGADPWGLQPVGFVPIASPASNQNCATRRTLAFASILSVTAFLWQFLEVFERS